MNRNAQLYQQACRSMVGGVNSPVRAHNAVGGDPLFITAGRGAIITDANGQEYIDCMGSWGPLILGHADPLVVDAVQDAASRGLSFGACCELEIQLAESVIGHMPHIQRLRLVNSGTEATMSALRLARAATGRDKLIKCRGCYHGHADSFLVAAGSGALTLGTPSSPGVTRGAAADTLPAEFNDLDSVRQCFDQHPGQIACIIVEPVAGNMGVIPPADGFLQGLRQLCNDHGALLIFDEVMTGFRIARGGAVERYQVQPDLVTLGKIIGGGMPVGAYGGRVDLMEQIAPLGPVYQAGTLSGNPLACAAGLATLDQLDDPVYHLLEAQAAMLENGMRYALAGCDIPWTINRVGSMLTLFFGIEQAKTFADLQSLDTEAYARYHAAMLNHGVLLPPSAYEAWFISRAHGEQEIQAVIDAHTKALATVVD